MLDTGKMNREIVIQRKTSTQDGEGGSSDTWATLYSCWCEIKPFSAQTLVKGQNVIYETKKIFKTRYEEAPLASTDDRILYNSNYYDIQSIINVDEGDHTLHIYGVSTD